MALVSYSDSDGSGSEAEVRSSVPSNSKPSINAGKPDFKKVVDRSNPRKIQVNLPETSKSIRDEGGEEQEPPTKRAKTGPGALIGFNSLLPAPKRDATTTGRANGGLGRGMSLKTGATPGFSKQPLPTIELSTEENNGGPEIQGDDIPGDTFNPQLLKESASKSEVEAEEAPKKGNSMMFKPLSVAKKPKKKKVTAADTSTTRDNTADLPKKINEPLKKASLFSSGDEKDLLNESTTTQEQYIPILYESMMSESTTDESCLDGSNPYITYEVEGERESGLNGNLPRPSNPPGKSQSLDNIAADLNLSESAKRQLFGRNKDNQSAINVVSFDIEREYAANEMLRQAGEQAEHNPVRAIAPGKHSLKQLVNAATNQKDALEEHFASGRRNKKEAGSKYGW